MSDTAVTTIYSSPACGACTASKTLMTSRQIPFVALDVTRDEGAMDTVRELGYRSLPVVVAPDGSHWSGLRPDLIMKITSQAAA